MTLFIRTTIEIGNTPTGGMPVGEEGQLGGIAESIIIRQSADETIIPATMEGAAGDSVQLAKAVLDRQADEVSRQAAAQLGQALDVIEGTGGL